MVPFFEEEYPIPKPTPKLGGLSSKLIGSLFKRANKPVLPLVINLRCSFLASDTANLVSNSFTIHKKGEKMNP